MVSAPGVGVFASVSDGISVEFLDGADAADWDAYVDSSPEGTIFHRSAWAQIFKECLRHKTHYLLARQGSQPVGCLPAVEIKSALFGHSIVSTPFLAYGGSIADSNEVHRALENRLCDIADARGVDFIEFRDRDRVREGCEAKSLYVTFRKEIPENEAECLKMVPRKQRAMIRKGIANGLQSRIDESIDVFYDILAESYRNLGTPILPRRYFANIKQLLGRNCEISTITKDGTPVASVMSYYYRDEVIPYYGGSIAAARALKANDFMYWDLLRRASEQGVRIFDYGRSRRDTGSYRFKRHWGFEPSQLNYQYRLVRQSELPDVSPNNPKYRLAISVWRKLPVGLTRFLGPPLARVLPG